MRQPKLSELVIDNQGTKAIRNASKSKKMKITINIDSDSLNILRSHSKASGIPYQRLLNIMLKQALKGADLTQSRLERLEKEIEKLKKKLAA